MKISTLKNIIAALFLLVAFQMLAEAQTKRIKKRVPSATDAGFFVPCAKALSIGLERVEKLHSDDITRRNNGDEGDSDTELLIEKNAFENYLRCRRADTEKKLKKMSPDERAAVNEYAKTARRIAEMRVNLLYGVQFDERYDDPVNYAVSLNAVALVEDYKGELAWIYLQTKDSNALGNTRDAERDEKQIGGLLKRIEKIAPETEKADKISAFKTEIEKTLAEIADSIGTEKRVTTAFLVRLLKMNLADDN